MESSNNKKRKYNTERDNNYNNFKYKKYNKIDYNKLPREDLITKLNQYKFTIDRRGYQIRGLYYVIKSLISDNPLTYNINISENNYLQNIKRELKLAKEHIENLKKKDNNNSNIPTDFQCNICFSNYKKNNLKDKNLENNSDHSPLALGCGHILCTDCFLKQNTISGNIHCPFCNKLVEKILPLYF